MACTLLCLMGLVLLQGRMTGQEVQEKLGTGWRLELAKGQWIDASVPGYVHTDLMAAGIIRDPFYGAQEQDAAWVAERAWKYSLNFDAGLVYGSRKTDLVFDGLDTYAEVYLNGKKIVSADNQFIRWRCDVTSLLKRKDNQLVVVFKPLHEAEDSLQQLYGLALPGGNRVFTRKGQWQYGWDWAPSLPSVGIWKTVRLEGYDRFRWDDVQIVQHFEGSEFRSAEAVITIESFQGTEIQVSVSHSDLSSQSQDFILQKGVNQITIPLHFNKEISYWWPAGMGDPNLYTLDYTISDTSGMILIQRSVKTGIRRVELVRDPDLLGESFYFRINGIPVFARGANWIPPDHFPSRISEQHYRDMLDEVSFAGMNMLRVWGGGIYEDDIFYDECDQRGIMVWQDFMFACGMYPGDDRMLKNIGKEAEFQVKRLRNHPSVVLWCGNNEVSEGWHRWGWPADYSAADSTRVWHDYLKIFEDLLPRTVTGSAPGLPYWPSSPSLGRGDRNHVFRGDAHYWGVWHDAEPFEMFRKNVPRFMSEFGFQSYPVMSTIRRFAPSATMSPGTEVMKVHQKHPRGDQLMAEYMKDWFPEPENFERYVYYSQLMQAEGMAIGILAHREAKPWCMGSLYWQFNDCWPAVSWSSVDYFGERKAMHYKVKEVFEPVVATVTFTGDQAHLTVINDDPQMDKVNFFFQLKDHHGQDIYSVYFPDLDVDVKGNTTTSFKLPEEVVRSYSENKLLCILTLSAEDRFISQRVVLPDKPKNIPFEIPEIRYKIEKRGEKFLITFWSNVFVYGMYVTAKDVKGSFSDNYFPVLPGSLKAVWFTPDEPVKSMDISYMHY